MTLYTRTDGPGGGRLTLLTSPTSHIKANDYAEVTPLATARLLVACCAGLLDRGGDPFHAAIVVLLEQVTRELHKVSM